MVKCGKNKPFACLGKSSLDVKHFNFCQRLPNVNYNSKVTNDSNLAAAASGFQVGFGSFCDAKQNQNVQE